MADFIIDAVGYEIVEIETEIVGLNEIGIVRLVLKSPDGKLYEGTAYENEIILKEKK